VLQQKEEMNDFLYCIVLVVQQTGKEEQKIILTQNISSYS
jgi:hypothetical protein